MRGGKFLAEESPEDLQSKYQCDTLEEVFLKLAILQNMGKRRRSSIAQEISEQVSVPAALTVCTTIIHSKWLLRAPHFIFAFCTESRLRLIRGRSK